MQRQIKFRAKFRNQHFKGWQYFDLLDILAPRQDFDSATICQSTGSEDKNGVEIYDGDIITNGTNNFKVIWASRFGGWGIVNPFTVNKTVNLLANSIGYQEVIGNIHDNPELLKGGQS